MSNELSCPQSDLSPYGALPEADDASCAAEPRCSDILSASLHAEVPRQGKDQEMLVRDKGIIRTFEKSATRAGGTIVAILDVGNQRIRCNGRKLVFKCGRVCLERLNRPGDETIRIVKKLRSNC